jgi:hypothetical protein
LLPALRFVDLSGNLLVCGIPRSLDNCSKLQALLLSSNQLDDVQKQPATRPAATTKSA